MSKTAKKFGLGQKVLKNFNEEKAGVVPNTKWKLNQIGKNWYLGETLHAGIGQGYFLSTPLQLCLMTAQLANGGFKIKPRLVVDENDQANNLQKYLKFRGENSNDQNNIDLQGKTGSSQIKRFTEAQREAEVKQRDITYKERDHAWFVAFAPVKDPKYAISVLVEHGGSGSSAAAPVAKKIIKKVIERHEIRNATSNKKLGENI